MPERKKEQKNDFPGIKIFPVPCAMGEIKENIFVNTIKQEKSSKKEIINQAFKFHSQGNISQAARYYKLFIKQGHEDAKVFSNYGIILRDLGKLKEAELLLRKAIKLKPDFANAHSIFGNILRDIGNLKEAELTLRKAIELKHDFANAHCNLGNILKDLGKLKEAEISTRKAIELKPNLAEAHSNLGSILSDLGKLQEAELLLRKAIELKPNLAEAHSNLGNTLRVLGKLKEAELSLCKAIELKPNFAEAHSNLGIILKDLGNEKDAIKHYCFALEKKPNNISFYINSKFNFSKIMEDISQIDTERKNYKKQIQILKNKSTMEYKNDIVFNTGIFYLPYHNRPDDKQILEEQSDTFSNIKGIVVNDFNMKKKINSNNNSHLKVGICSEFLRYSHVVGKLYIKVLLDLIKTDLEITIYVPPGKKQLEEYEILKKSFKRVICLPKFPINAKREIINDNLDLLFYPDIGMSSYTYMLALSRLALVQVNSLGHTNTSGIKTIDYFITSDVEPETSDERYTEHLIRFSRLPFNYSKPVINETKIKTNNKHIISSEEYFNIGLIQTLFKIHPDYDEILGKILKEIPQSRLILVKDAHHSVTEALKDRWRKTNKLLLQKSIFLDRMSNNDFINTIKYCDIMLDPFYYGSGNTFYESMAFGTPFITYKNQKSKIPIAGYRQMKIFNPPIASSHEDYINWCKVYSMDKNLLNKTRKSFIEKSNQYLFNDNEIYKQYYKFFNEAVALAKKGKFLSEDWSP